MTIKEQKAIAEISPVVRVELPTRQNRNTWL